MKLDDHEVERLLGETEGWKQDDDKWMSRKYRFAKFPDAIAFVNQVAEIAERRNHHPMISIDYRMVTLRLSSWNAGGITQEDFASAAAYNEAFNKNS